MSRFHTATTDEGYLRGLQGLPWETPTAVPPSPEDTAASFLNDVRKGAVALRGRIKKGARDCLDAFRAGFVEAFPAAEKKPFLNAVAALWVRWLALSPHARDPIDHSLRNGRKVGEKLREEYGEGVIGNLAVFLLDKRIHLDDVRGFLRMRGWLLGTIENLRRDSDPERRVRAEILNANLSSIVLRAQHNAGPDYAARVAAQLSSITGNLDRTIRNLSSAEPEAASYLRKNRNTIITRALHSGALDYAERVGRSLPSALKDLERRIDSLHASSPRAAEKIRAKKRTIVYRALTNGRLKLPAGN